MKEDYQVLLFYKYTPVLKPEELWAWQKGICSALNLKGRIIIAKEGINGTVEGFKKDTEKYMEELRKIGVSVETKPLGNFRDIQFKTSVGTGESFPKLKVKIKDELVSLKFGEDDVNPNDLTGKHLPAKELKKWYENNEDFCVLDMRNDYEFKVGHFKNSINPKLENSRDLPKILPELENLKDKKVLTVCTGGVRCEKMSGYLLKKGFKEVYQLDGGMHSYMEKFPGEDFLGTLYTFDNRVVMDFGGEREVIGECDKCKEKSERYVNCANSFCHKHLVVCENCSEADGTVFCSDPCKESDKVTV